MQALVALMISAGDQGPGHTRIALPWAFQSASTHRLMPSAPTAMPYTPLSPQGFKAYCTGSCILHHTTLKPHTTTAPIHHSVIVRQHLGQGVQRPAIGALPPGLLRRLLALPEPEAPGAVAARPTDAPVTRHRRLR